MAKVETMSIEDETLIKDVLFSAFHDTRNEVLINQELDDFITALEEGGIELIIKREGESDG